MRHTCIFVAVAIGTLSLAGCGFESSGPSAFNPATNVDIGFSSFTLTEATDTALFNDLFKAVEPADSSDSDAVAAAEAIREQMALFLGLTLSETPDVTAVRNPLDLMRRVIGEDEVQNFVEARQYISSRIDAGEAGEYSNTTNGVTIRFTDRKAFEDGLPIQDYSWGYPIVKWVYTPLSTNNVIRIITWVATGTFEEGTTRPSATLGTEYSSRDFLAVGYNDEARRQTEGSIVIEGEREMSFTRIFNAVPQTDSILIDGTKIGTSDGAASGPTFDFAGTNIDCLRIKMNYAMPSVTIYTSLNEAPQITDPNDSSRRVANPDYCANTDTPALSYSTAPTGLRS